MKRMIIRCAIAICTFIVGVVAATVWLSRPALNLTDIHPLKTELNVPGPALPEATPDSTIYSVKLCDLVREKNRYDGKFIRTQADYVQGIDTSGLSDPQCKAWLRPSCVAAGSKCQEIWDRVGKASFSSRSSRLRIDVIGKYSADVVDPNPLQGGNHVHLLEIIELMGVR
jgi:hypothetical protein